MGQDLGMLVEPIASHVGEVSLDEWADGPSFPVAAEPVFILGSLRSGASLLYASLGQHPDVLAVMDTNWITHLARSLQQAYSEGSRRRATAQLDIMGVELEDFYAYFGEAIDRLVRRGLAPDGPEPALDGGTAAGEDAAGQSGRQPTRWLDVSPDLCFHVVGLVRLFPRAKFVHVLRDAPSVVRTLTDESLRNVYRSQFRQFTEADAYQHWLDVVSACVEAEQALGSDTILRIRRDDLVGSPEPTLQACLAFLDLPFAKACLRPFR
jgi:hypothetical protein